jgi:phenylacetate-CoA ligase
VAYARANSPYYRELYRDLPDMVDDPALLPVTDKNTLMGHFDEWVTDRQVTRERVEAFVADPDLVGARFQDRYLVATTSGTSGVRGLFVLDERNLAVPNALGSRSRGMLGVRDLGRMLVHGGRIAIIAAPAGHFYTVASTERFRRDRPRLSRIMRIFPTDQPLPALVDELNRYNPASLVGFLSMLTQLVGEQEAGRLRIRPALIVPGGETVTADVRDRIAAAFHAKVRAAYAATECDFLSVGCVHGWYHVNSDWAVVEPVDADYRPVPAGQPSHTVLISNLANRVQPFLRYDLGDRVLLRPDPCPCGSPLPAPGGGPRRRHAHLPHRPGRARQHLAHALRHAAGPRSRHRPVPDRPDRALHTARAPTNRGRRRDRPRMADGARRDHPPAHRAQGRPRHARMHRGATTAVARWQVPPDHPAHHAVRSRQ